MNVDLQEKLRKLCADIQATTSGDSEFSEHPPFRGGVTREQPSSSPPTEPHTATGGRHESEIEKLYLRLFADLMLIGGTKNQLAGALVVNPRIKSPSDLKGTKIAITRKGSNTEYMAKAVPVHFGLNPDRDATFIQTGGEPQSVAALKSGGVDAASSVPPNNPRALAPGFKQLVEVTALKIPYVATMIAAPQKTIDAKTSILQRFMEAMADGVHRFQTDEPCSLKVIGKYTRSPSKQDLKVSYRVEGGIMDRGLNVHEDALRATLEEIRKDTPQAARAKPEDFVDRRFINDLRQSGYLDRLWK